MNDDDLVAASRRVRHALVASFGTFVTGRLREMGIEPSDGVKHAIEVGSAWLDGRLSELFASEPASQRNSPLALFQAALAFPTEALGREGAAPVRRDEATAAALPGDHYDLAPASSQSLGEEAWSAHVAWGVAKAKALGAEPAPEDPTPPAGAVAPVVALVSVDPSLRDEIGIVVARAEFALAVWRNPGALEAGLVGGRPAMAIVDLDHRRADDAIRRLSEAGVPTVACGTRVDDLVTARSLALGADEVMPRTSLADRLPGWLPRMT